MKRALFVLVIVLFIINCSSDHHQERLIGEWYFDENPSMGLIFTADSLFIKSTLYTKQNWNVDESNIILKNTVDYMSRKLEGEEYRTHFVYSLNKACDTLVWRAKKDSTNRSYRFVKKE